MAKVLRSGKTSCRQWAAESIAKSELRKLYQRDSIPIITGKRLTTETRRQGDLVFAELCVDAGLGGRKLLDKNEYCRQVLHTAKIAMHGGKLIRCSRSKEDPNVSRIKLQVIDAAVKNGMFVEHRSPKGAKHMSRLEPTAKLKRYADADPWTFDPSRMKKFVYLRNRLDKEKKDLRFDPTEETPADVQLRLSLVNRVVAMREITYQPRDPWDDHPKEPRRLRPVAYALFDRDPRESAEFDWALHGRIYTGRYGHQGLRKTERGSIRFAGEQSVELDYSGLHPRLLCHLEGAEFEGDPYALWGAETTGPQRLMAKVLINALINAVSDKAAVKACNYAMSSKSRSESGWKTGKALDDARRLRAAQRKTNLSFNNLVPLARSYHELIAHRFGQDMGIRLMRTDAAIALDVLYHFASLCIPCLSCHDSFIVPASMEQELHRVMMLFYYQRIGHFPVIRRG